MEGLLSILAWLVDAIGTSAKRHTANALEFIRAASARAEARKQKRNK
jgi:hypothetical protein